ncbi:hypothetical protein CYMTET_55793 [Cymbomonas tetramitiformis]|uniref:Uncharacterized protein n=1 Tax=Cymbomonas tetramitiformis TaxID=36881 RepID=A0AAE0BDN1_9CHLO|nr:hypothetical protein CYMTET_55793 [Cymbomonas tetramitiformis]
MAAVQWQKLAKVPSAGAVAEAGLELGAVAEAGLEQARPIQWQKLAESLGGAGAGESSLELRRMMQWQKLAGMFGASAVAEPGLIVVGAGEVAEAG